MAQEGMLPIIAAGEDRGLCEVLIMIFGLMVEYGRKKREHKEHGVKEEHITHHRM